MDIRELSPEDARGVAAVVEVRNAASKVDAPFCHPDTATGYVGHLRHGWDGEPPRAFAGWRGDTVVGELRVYLSEWDNRHLGWLGIVVHPDHRRRGLGSELLAFGCDQLRAAGRTSLGIDGWDIAAARGFAARHDLPKRGTAVNRRQVLADVEPGFVQRLFDEAAAAATDYELLRIGDTTPPELLDAVAEMTAAINDAPTDDLDIEDEVFPAERILAYEQAQRERGNRLYRIVARHRHTGQLAGHSVVAIEAERPTIGDQHDTSVVVAHRGHRLGLLLKADMLRWLAETEPALETIDTWNAESNDHMIAVNERLGYRWLGRELQFQRDV
jgi:RimJ/RimL family protein N-acetyltransferase